MPISIGSSVSQRCTITLGISVIRESSSSSWRLGWEIWIHSRQVRLVERAGRQGVRGYEGIRATGRHPHLDTGNSEKYMISENANVIENGTTPCGKAYKVWINQLDYWIFSVPCMYLFTVGSIHLHWTETSWQRWRMKLPV